MTVSSRHRPIGAGVRARRQPAQTAQRGDRFRLRSACASPLFDDLVLLHGVRAQLLISRDALVGGDVAKAKTFYEKFKPVTPPTSRS
jgi:hypothetical protein